MAITFIAPAALSGTTDSTTLNITLPTVVAGDMMLLEYVHRGATAGTIGGAGGTGWTNKLSRDFATATFSAHLYWKRSDGSESGAALTVTGLTNSCAGCVTVYRGVKSTGDPFEAATAEDNASADESHAAITTVTPGAWVGLGVGNSPDVAVTSPSTTSPGALTQRAERLNTTGTDTSYCSNSAEKATTGSTGALTWAISPNGPSASFAWALTPELLAVPVEVGAKVVDTILNVFLTVLLATVPAETLKVADGPVTAELVTIVGDESANPSDSLKIGASGRIELIGLGNPIHVVDGPVTAALVTGEDLARNVGDESLKVADGLVNRFLDPIQTSVSDSLKVIDQTPPTVAMGAMATALEEPAKVGASGFAELIDTGERIRVSDGPVVPALTGADLSRAISDESLKVADVVVNRFLDPLLASASDSLKVQDQTPPSATLTTLGDLSRAVTAESLAVQDLGFVELSRDETLKLADSLTASITPEFALGVAEGLKVVDQTPPSASLGNLDAGLLAESLKVVDTLTNRTLDPEQASLSEALKVVDTVILRIDPIQTLLSDSLKVVDGPVLPLIGGNLGIAVPDESLKVVDQSPTRRLDPLFLSVQAESLKVVDSIVSAIDPELVSVSEALTVVDTIIGRTLDPEQTALSDSLTVVDTILGPTLTPEITSLSEALRPADGPVQATIAGPGEVQISSDSLKVVDTVIGTRLDPVQASPSESLKVQDQTPLVSLATGVLITAEALKVSDSASARLDPLQSSALADGLRVSDSVSAFLTTLLASIPAEALHVVDGPASGSVGILRAVVQDEALSVRDGVVLVFIGTPIPESYCLVSADIMWVTVAADSVYAVVTLTDDAVFWVVL